MKEKNNFPRPNGDSTVQRLEHALKDINLEALARQTGFRRRAPRKLTPLAFIQSCFLILLPDQASLRAWAIVIGLVQNLTYSKQALCKRLNGAAGLFVQRVLHGVLFHLSLGAQRVLPPALDSFGRVLVQDSVLLTLPPRLARFFPGSRNQSSRRRQAQLRVQALLDLKHEQFVHFRHSAFTHNDAAAAGEGLEFLQRGDLLIRDLGYFVHGVLRQLQERGVKFLSRLKINAGLFDLAGRPLDLVRLLRGRVTLDREVLLGSRERLRVRLVALKVSEAEANRRRRLARRNHGYQPTQKYRFLLGWNIYVTNVDAHTWSTREVGRVYGLRYRIETTFRAWKQHFKIEDVPAGSPAQVEVLLYARLLFITLFEVHYLAGWDYRIQKQARPPISHLKLAALMPLYLPLELLRQLQPRVEEALEKQVPYHCTYERRRKRKNFVERLQLG
jgi:Transposase DDE domain